MKSNFDEAVAFCGKQELGILKNEDGNQDLNVGAKICFYVPNENCKHFCLLEKRGGVEWYTMFGTVDLSMPFMVTVGHGWKRCMNT